MSGFIMPCFRLSPAVVRRETHFPMKGSAAAAAEEKTYPEAAASEDETYMKPPPHKQERL